MIKNFGIDIIENNRFLDKIEDEKFINRILSPKEIINYKQIVNSNRKMEYLASRFSVKESLIKALGDELVDFNYPQVSVLNKANGAPYIETEFKVDYQMLVSISHSENYTITQVIMQKILSK